MKIEKMDLSTNFPHQLTLVFVLMKCMGYIDWSWLMVFSPILAYTFLSLIVLIALVKSG